MEKKMFEDIVSYFGKRYPQRHIKTAKNTWGDDMVHVDGKEIFNYGGFSLLFNLQRLVKEIADEV